MSQHADQSLFKSGWPVCPHCQITMMFASVCIQDDDHDLRTFECQVCQYAKNVVVAAEDASGYRP
jgi:hypothetical protein